MPQTHLIIKSEYDQKMKPAFGRNEFSSNIGFVSVHLLLVKVTSGDSCYCQWISSCFLGFFSFFKIASFHTKPAPCAGKIMSQ